MAERPKRINDRYSGSDLNGYGIGWNHIAHPEGTLGWHIAKLVSETPEKLVRGAVTTVARGVRKIINTNSRLRRS
jgi:hypothetical protein